VQSVSSFSTFDPDPLTVALTPVACAEHRTGWIGERIISPGAGNPRLANALYPKGSEDKRLVEAVLLGAPR
jgi:hypothetical protein